MKLKELTENQILNLLKTSQRGFCLCTFCQPNSTAYFSPHPTWYINLLQKAEVFKILYRLGVDLDSMYCLNLHEHMAVILEDKIKGLLLIFSSDVYCLHNFQSEIDELFKVDFKDVADRLQAIPLYERLGIPQKYFEVGMSYKIPTCNWFEL